MSQQCQQCDADCPQDARFCPQCGSDLSPATAAASPAPPPQDAQTPRGKFAAFAMRNDPQEGPEEMLWQGRFSARAMIGPAAAMAVGSLALLILAIMIELATQGWLVVLGVILVAWIGLGLRLVYRQLSVHYYLTNQRLLHEQGLLWREVDRIEAIDIDDVSLQQGPVERMLGIGTVQIRSSDQSTPHFEIVGIEDARDLARRLDEVRRQERMRRGLHIESV